MSLERGRNDVRAAQIYLAPRQVDLRCAKLEQLFDLIFPALCDMRRNMREDGGSTWIPNAYADEFKSVFDANREQIASILHRDPAKGRHFLPAVESEGDPMSRFANLEVPHE